MSLGTILIIILIIFLLGGFSGRFGGYGLRHGPFRHGPGRHDSDRAGHPVAAGQAVVLASY
jgi:Protein of unknown function (DUF3309)